MRSGDYVTITDVTLRKYEGMVRRVVERWVVLAAPVSMWRLGDQDLEEHEEKEVMIRLDHVVSVQVWSETE